MIIPIHLKWQERFDPAFFVILKSRNQFSEFIKENGQIGVRHWQYEVANVSASEHTNEENPYICRPLQYFNFLARNSFRSEVQYKTFGWYFAIRDACIHATATQSLSVKRNTRLLLFICLPCSVDGASCAEYALHRVTCVIQSRMSRLNRNTQHQQVRNDE